MKKVEIIEGVAAEFEGEFWGLQDGLGSQYEWFGNLFNAKIFEPLHCKKPTDITWYADNMHNPKYEALKKAKLVKVKKTITTEVELIE
jgi:hypothetical protein